MIVIEPGEEIGAPAAPDVKDWSPAVIRRAPREERPRTEPVLPRLERVPAAPRRGWSRGLRGEVEGMFRSFGVVDRGDELVNAKGEYRR